MLSSQFLLVVTLIDIATFQRAFMSQQQFECYLVIPSLTLYPLHYIVILTSVTFIIIIFLQLFVFNATGESS